jgi:hypothetical protein
LPLQQQNEREVPLTQEEYDEHLAAVAHNQATLKYWADSAPCNFAHWYRLVEVPASPNHTSGRVNIPTTFHTYACCAKAERKRLRLPETKGGRQSVAIIAEMLGLYQEVFDMALENGFVQDAALAKELSCQVLCGAIVAHTTRAVSSVPRGSR